MLTRRTLMTNGLSTVVAPAFPARADDAAPFSRLQAAAREAQARADALLKAQGLVRGTVGERLRVLAADERWLYPDSDAGRDRAVADMNARLAALRPRLPEAFGDLAIPAADVRRMSAADVAAGRGGYRVQPPDGSAGAYYVDLRTIRTRPAWTLATVAFHEVTPGHLLQLPLAIRASPSAAGRSPAFFEGWAAYAEQLACDLGAYRDDPRGEIGYLHWRLFRLARGLADLGLRTQGWDRQKAIGIVTALQGFPAAFISIEADVDRAIANPGKVAAEALVALDLADRRPKARAQWPAYHRTVLT